MKRLFTLIIILITAVVNYATAQNVNIPDADFKGALVGNPAINSNNDGEIQITEAAAFTGAINVGNIGISSLTGIEAFVNITALYCNNNNLSSLDISANTKLVILSCYFNQLGSLNVSGCPDLETLYCGNNTIFNLDVSANSKLSELNCANGELRILNITNNNQHLRVLDCHNNFLDNLYFPANTPNTSINCFFNQLSSIVLNNVRNITAFQATSNDFDVCIQVDDVAYMKSTFASSIDGFATYRISCGNVNIPDANFKSALLINPAINTNNDGEIHYTEAEAYTGAIDVTFRDISDLTGIEAFTSLSILDCSDNNLTALNVSANTALTQLYCSANQITSLDLSHNSLLSVLACGANQIAGLNLSANPLLTRLYCQGNFLYDLDLSSNSLLTQIFCSSNRLYSLNISNGNNSNLTSFNATSNTNLTCIRVDDIAYMNTNFSSGKDPGASYGIICIPPVINFPNANFKAALVTNPAIDTNGDDEIDFAEAKAYTGGIDVSSSNINDLTGIEVFTSLTALNCSGNNLTTLDLSANSALTAIECNNNQLTVLNIRNGNNTNLINFSSSSNPVLACIEVDNVAYMGANWSAGKDAASTFSTNCITPCTGTVNIPDANFKAALLANNAINTNGDGEIQCAEAAAYSDILDVYNKGINDLTGIEAFTNIYYLDCSNNNLTNLDVSANTALVYLTCAQNQITTLNTSANINLRSLYCQSNQLTSLIFTPLVEALNCSSNQLTSLNVSGNTNLFRLYCNDNQITSLDVSASTNLEEIHCQDNKLTNLVLPPSPVLEWVYCFNNLIQDLDVSANNTLKYLYCYNNKITSLNVSNCSNLQDLNCGQNLLQSLDISSNVSLQSLTCYNNQIAILNVSANTQLKSLDCSSNNALNTLDVSSNTQLITLLCGGNNLPILTTASNPLLSTLSCGYNPLSNLNLTLNPALSYLEFSYTNIASIDLHANVNLTQIGCIQGQLTSLDVSSCPLLERLNCQANPITSLNLTGNPLLTTLYCHSNQLTSLNLSSNNQLRELGCEYNSLLTSVNIQNGNNNNLAALTFKNNPSLTCIQVDDPAYMNTNWSAGKDATATFSTDCNPCIVNIPDANFKAALLANAGINTNNDTEIQCAEAAAYTGAINVSSLGITDLTGIEAFTSITELDCSLNSTLAGLDISGNLLLTHLNCGGDYLEELDVSSNTALTNLSIDFNNLTNLNLSANTALSFLNCSYNQLANLDLSANTALADLYCNNNNLSSLNVSTNTALTTLVCSYNPIMSLNVSLNTSLYRLVCSNNQLTNLDISANTILEILHCEFNSLTSLNVAANSLLSKLFCGGNAVTSLNLSANTRLEEVDCRDGQLDQLNIKNGHNNIIYNFQATNNPSLTCIKVDDVNYSDANWSAGKDATATFSTNCTPCPTNSWTSAANNGNWNDPNNWCNGTLPTTATDAIVPTGATPYPTLSGNATVKALEIQAGANISVDANTLIITGTVTGTGTLKGSAASNLVLSGSSNTGTLYFDQTLDGTSNAFNNITINKTGIVNENTVTLGNKLILLDTYTPSAGILNTGGNLHLRSTAAKTARIAEGSSAGGYISGNVTVERYIPANASRAWRLLSVPTKGTQTIRQAWMEGDINTNQNQNSLPGYGTIISTGTPAQLASGGFDAVTLSTSVRNYNGISFDKIPSVNVPIEDTMGYFLFVRGDRSALVNGTVTTPTILRTKGTLYQGTQVSYVNPGKFKLVGNVFASAIDFERMSKQGISNTFYIWDAKLGKTGGYETFNGINEFRAIIGGGSWAPDEINTAIQSGQAFFVYGLSTGGQVTMPESCKTDGKNINGLRPADPVSTAKLHTRLYTPSVKNPLDGNVIIFDKAYSNAVDANDAAKFENPGENFSIEAPENLLAAEARQPVNSCDTIFFNMQHMKQQQYSLEFTVSNIKERVTAYLEDSYAGTRTAIDLHTVTKINFTVDATAGAAAANRFRVVFKQDPEIIMDAKPSITLSPNPAEGAFVNMYFKNMLKGKYELRLFNSTGQSVLSTYTVHAGGTGMHTVNLPQFISSGSYRVQAISKAGRLKYTAQLIINRNN